MLLGSGERPRASGICSPLLLRFPTASCSTCGTPSPSSGPAAPTPSKQLAGRTCLLAWSTRLRDVLSWLTADVLGRPLLHADDTNAVGKRIAAHASRVEKRLRVETESTRNTVGKARVVAAKKSPSCCPRWPQLKRRAKRHVPCCSRSRTTRSCQPRPSSVGEKRPASHWRQREVDETCAKVSSVGHGGR